MRTVLNFNEGWAFTKNATLPTEINSDFESVCLPHSWNALDGQDGGNDYWRGTLTYEKTFAAPAFDKNTQDVYLEFRGVNASAKVTLNGQVVATHDGGYSTFRANITDVLQAENNIVVEADNSVNDRVYPQKADFTFYGGIYRDVHMIVLNKNHFDMDHFGGPGIAVNAEVKGVTVNVTSPETAQVLQDIMDKDKTGK